MILWFGCRRERGSEFLGSFFRDVSRRLFSAGTKKQKSKQNAPSPGLEQRRGVVDRVEERRHHRQRVREGHEVDGAQAGSFRRGGSRGNERRRVAVDDVHDALPSRESVDLALRLLAERRSEVDDVDGTEALEREVGKHALHVEGRAASEVDPFLKFFFEEREARGVRVEEEGGRAF
jgi:hypothetical protein